MAEFHATRLEEGGWEVCEGSGNKPLLLQVLTSVVFVFGTYAIM